MLLFYTPWKHQKTFKEYKKEYKKATIDCNELNKVAGWILHNSPTFVRGTWINHCISSEIFKRLRKKAFLSYKHLKDLPTVNGKYRSNCRTFWSFTWCFFYYSLIIYYYYHGITKYLWKYSIYKWTHKNWASFSFKKVSRTYKSHSRVV